jgi:hypothetical protein
MSGDDAFSKNTNEVGSRLFFLAEALYSEFSQEEVLVGMAMCLAQSIAGRNLSPGTLNSVMAAVGNGLRHTGPEFSDAMQALNKAARLRSREQPPV